MKHFTFSGEITRAKFDTEMGIFLRGLLNDVGNYSVRNMTDITHKTDASGRLSDGITWQTAIEGTGVGSKAEEGDKIAKPREAGTVNIGTDNPYAIFREKGSGVHTSSVGSKEFIDAMKIWCSTQLNINWDGSPDDRGRFWAIIQHIRNNNTPAAPFVSVAKNMATPYAIKQTRTMIKQFFKGGKK